MLVDVKLDSHEESRPEISLTDFVLPAELCRLMNRLDEIKNVTIDSLDVRAGIPRRVVFESRFTELPQ